MSLGSFDARFLWKWDSPGAAIIEHENRANIIVSFDEDATASLAATALGYPDADKARSVGFVAEADGEFSTLTRYGRAATLLATVADVVQAYLRRAEPPVLVFNATKKRAAIYNALIQRLDVPLGYHVYAERAEPVIYGREYAVLRVPYKSPRGFFYDRLR